MRPSALFFAILCSSSALPACAGEALTNESKSEPATDDGANQELIEQVIGEGYNGETLAVIRGRSFTVALADENAWTGYRWRVTQADRSIGQPKEGVSSTMACSGCGNVTTFRWSTKFASIGKHLIRIEYARPGEPTKPPAKTMEVTIDIQEDEATRSCGGEAGLTCGANEFCDYALSHMCGAADHTGRCTSKPEACPDLYKPVCGCDRKTYPSSCEANLAGVAVFRAAACDGT